MNTSPTKTSHQNPTPTEAENPPPTPPTADPLAGLIEMSSSLARDLKSESARTPPGEPTKSAAPKPVSPSKPSPQANVEWRKKHFELVEYHAKVKNMAISAEGFCKRFAFNIREPHTLLVAVGENGIGKTMLAKAVYAYCNGVFFSAWDHGYWPKPPKVEFIRFAPFVAKFETQQCRMEDIISADLLVIDDIGAEVDKFKSGEPIAILTEILDGRAGKFTFATTNVPQAKWKERWDNRVSDRLQRHAAYVDATGGPRFSVKEIL